MRRAAGVDDRYTRVQFLENGELGNFQGLAALYLAGQGQQHPRTFVTVQGLGAEGPAGTDDQVAGHADLFSLVKNDLQHVDPFIAEPFQLFGVQGVGSGGEGNRVDFHAADTGVLEQVQLADQFFGLDAVAVPPPADEGAVPVLERSFCQQRYR